MSVNRIFYVDFENVRNLGLKGLINLRKTDLVYIFYSDGANSFTVHNIEEIRNSEADIQFVHVDVGTKNALDFQLVTMLFININKEDTFFIVTKDHGFDAAIKMGERFGFTNIRRITRLSLKELTVEEDDTISDSTTTSEESEESAENEIIADTQDLESFAEHCIKEKLGESNEIPLIISGLQNTNTKFELYNFYRHNFGNAKGLEIYKSVSSEYEEFKSLLA